MKISETMQAAINRQIGRELDASFLYLGISAWFETTIYAGFAKWMRVQSDEERDHAMRFFKYLNDRDGVVRLQSIEQPPASLDSPLAAFQQVLKSEEKNTRHLHELYDTANAEKDYATKHFLSWYLEEQVEEEKSARDWLSLLEAAGDHVNALMRLDQKASLRAED